MQKVSKVCLIVLGLVISMAGSSFGTKDSSSSGYDQDDNSERYRVGDLARDRKIFTGIVDRLSSKADKFFLYELWFSYLLHEERLTHFALRKGYITRDQAKAYLTRVAQEHHVAADALKRQGDQEFANNFRQLGQMATQSNRRIFGKQKQRRSFRSRDYGFDDARSRNSY